MTLGFGRSTDSFARRKVHPVYADRAMVAAAHPAVVDAGMHILHEGGNAFDIAVASGLAAAVVMPEMCGLGGELFAVFTVKGQQPAAIQASGRSPRGASYDFMKQQGGTHMPYRGVHSVAVPGMVDAFFHILEQYGTMSFAQVVEPAIDLARNGYPLLPVGARDIADYADLLEQDEAAAAIFLAHGRAPQPGTRMVQTDLATTLEKLAEEGPRTFYEGDLARRMVSYLRDHGSKFDLEDFSSYQTDHTSPYSVTYRGHTVYQTAIPSQGIIMLESLNIVENADLSNPFSAESIHTMVEAKKLAYADRTAYLADMLPNPVETLLSKPYGAARFAQINPEAANDSALAGKLNDGDTTYLCTADGEGNMVSFIQSVSASFGSGVVAGDTGVVMNNRVGRGFSIDQNHPNVYAPGKRSMHTLNAYLISDEQGRPVVVGGTPGGDGQPQWNMQTIVGLIDAGLDVQAAIEQPRWINWPGTDPSTIDNPFELRMENRVDPEVRARLADLGHNVVEREAWSGGGAVQAIARDPESGLLSGGSDPRVEGLAMGR